MCVCVCACYSLILGTGVSYRGRKSHCIRRVAVIMGCTSRLMCLTRHTGRGGGIGEAGGSISKCLSVYVCILEYVFCRCACVRGVIVLTNSNTDRTLWRSFLSLPPRRHRLEREKKIKIKRKTTKSPSIPGLYPHPHLHPHRRTTHAPTNSASPESTAAALLLEEASRSTRPSRPST